MSAHEPQPHASRNGRNWRWTRAGAAAGLVSLVMTTIGFVLHGNLPTVQSGTDLATWVAHTNDATFWIGIYLELLGYLVFLVFGAWLWSVVYRRTNGLDWLSTAGLVAVGLFIGASSIDDGIWLGLLQSAHHGTEAGVLALVRDLGENVFNVSFMFLGLFAVLVGGVSAWVRSLPRWMGATAAVLGVGCLVPPIALIASILFELWIVVVCLIILVRPATAHREAADAWVVPAAA
jgi:hypothetical protein